jgi:MOSC domain-containing protein YiiM
MVDIIPLATSQLHAGLDYIQQSPQDQGVLELIVRRPQVDQREVLEKAELDLVNGLVGDNWLFRFHPSRWKDSTHFDTQITVMNSRMISLLAPEKENWPIAGDQLFVDLDLSIQNVPAGTRLAIGSVIIEVSDKPHTGCKKFSARFGQDALDFVNSAVGKQLRLRGLNSRIIQPGVIHVKDRVIKI